MGSTSVAWRSRAMLAANSFSEPPPNNSAMKVSTFSKEHNQGISVEDLIRGITERHGPTAPRQNNKARLRLHWRYGFRCFGLPLWREKMMNENIVR
jgi:hypothetical protein